MCLFPKCIEQMGAKLFVVFEENNNVFQCLVIKQEGTYFEERCDSFDANFFLFLEGCRSNWQLLPKSGLSCHVAP